MAGNESFFFSKPVGILEEMGSNEQKVSSSYSRPVRAEIKMVQNGYELDYENKSFIAKTLPEALEMIKSWMEMNEKEMSKGEKEA